jgi:hypothetical protein
LTARLQSPKLCLSPQLRRVRHELRPPALATPDRRPGGLPIASSTRAPRSGAGPVKCIVGSASAASCATTTDSPLNAVPSPRDCQTAWDRSRLKGRVAACRGRTKPLRWFPRGAASAQIIHLRHTQIHFFLPDSLRSSFLAIRRYFDYYHNSRTHRALDDNAPFPRVVEPPGRGKVAAIPQVGGLHHRYTRVA